MNWARYNMFIFFFVFCYTYALPRHYIIIKTLCLEDSILSTRCRVEHTIVFVVDIVFNDFIGIVFFCWLDSKSLPLNIHVSSVLRVIRNFTALMMIIPHHSVGSCLLDRFQTILFLELFLDYKVGEARATYSSTPCV